MENLDQIVKNDLILLDIMLPEVSGFQIYEEIMDKYPGAKEKILFLTAKADLKTLEFFRSHDCKYITKPFDPYELINTIKKFF
jgi:DNA-binding response OmpR family regulator